MTRKRGINLDQVVRAWKSLGGTVEPIRRTGELRFTHPRIARPHRVNGRRKDAAANLVSALNKLERGDT